MKRSRISWLYWLMFIGCVALSILLNLPWPSTPQQDMSRLLRDNWFLWGFNYFGILLTAMAALIIDDAWRKNMRWPFYMVPYFVIGILPLSIYMARRPAADLVKRQTPRLFEWRGGVVAGVDRGRRGYDCLHPTRVASASDRYNEP